MAGLFKLYPQIKERYMQLVPLEMSQEIFWSKVFQTLLYHRGVSLTGGTTEDDLFKDLDLDSAPSGWCSCPLHPSPRPRLCHRTQRGNASANG